MNELIIWGAAAIVSFVLFFKALSVIVKKQEYFEITDGPDKKTSEIFAEARRLYDVITWYSDEQLDAEFPAPMETTTRYFLKNVEPDPKTLRLSVNQTLEMGITQDQGITLRERMIMGIIYFIETGNHLDIKGLTVCSGSRNSGGNVPSVYSYYDGKVSVSCYGVDSSRSGCGVRRVVS